MPSEGRHASARTRGSLPEPAAGTHATACTRPTPRRRRPQRALRMQRNSTRSAPASPRVSHHDSGHPVGFKTSRLGETMASRPASKMGSASKGTTKRLSAPVRDTKTDLAGFAKERLILVWPWPLSRAMPDLNNELYWSRSLSSLKPPFLPTKMCAPDALSYFPNGFSPKLGE